MAPFWVDDLPALFADLGETWTFGALTALGILDEQDEVRAGPEGTMELQGRVRTVLLRATDFPTLTVGSPLTGPDAVTYRVRAVEREPPDGVLKRVTIVAQTT